MVNWLCGVVCLALQAQAPAAPAASQPAGAAATRPATTQPAAEVASPAALDELERKVGAAWGRVRSLQAKVTSTNAVAGFEGRAQTFGTGTYELLREGDQVLARMDLSTTTIQYRKKREQTVEGRFTNYLDGTFFYTVYEIEDQSHIEKAKLDAIMSGDGLRAFVWLRANNKIMLLPDEKIAGRPAYVLRAEGHEGISHGRQASATYAFDQQTGFIVRIVQETDDGTTGSTLTYTDLEVNTPVDARRVKFEVPSNAQLIDRTGETP